jgi:tol-pal system protein YbgF
MMRYLIVSLLFLPATVLAQQNNQMLEVLQQLTRLESEVRQLRGEVERLTYENKRLKSQQNDLYTDLDQRLRSLQAGGTGSTGMQTSAPMAPDQLAIEPVVSQPVQTPGARAVSPMMTESPASAPVTADGTMASITPSATVPQQIVQPALPIDPAQEQADYKNAFNLLKVGKYDEAIVAYSDFLRKYPSSSYAANAQYWLGEANYVRRQFPVAIEEFQKVVMRYPDSRKLPDAMLKIGYIHYELKQSDDARRVLTELTQKFPGTTAARLADNRLQRMKLEGR